MEQKYTESFMTYKDKEYDFAVGYRKPIKNGSKFILGGECSQITTIIHQHFNWFQKLMWKWCFGFTVEDYNEE